MRRSRFIAATGPPALALALLVSAPAVSYAEPCDHGEHVGNPHCDPDPAATPELGSGVLFGVGALALAGLVWRQRRQSPD